MTSWVWMKGIDVAIADPIEPVTSYDERQSVKALIEEHRDKIDKIQSALANEDPRFDPKKHDDLWILRFWLSHKKSKKAIAAAKTTLLFRQKYKLDDKDLRGDATLHKSQEPHCKKYCEVRCRGDGIVCGIPDKKRGVIMFIKFAQMDPEAAKILSEETWDYSFVYSSEWTHQWLDYITRTTGRLTKSVRFIDMTGIQLRHFDRASSKRDSKIMDEMEDVYPQLLETIYACYPPIFMHLIWAFIRPIMPRRIIDKIDLIEPSKNETERNRLLKHVSKEDLPLHLGGDNTVLPKDWEI